MAIIPPYNATALFGNIDAIVLVNEAFLADLERSFAGIESSHGGPPEGVGDVIIRHVSPQVIPRRRQGRKVVRAQSEGSEEKESRAHHFPLSLFQFKQMKAFDCYRTYYDKCEDAQAMFADMISKRKSFQDFVQVSDLLSSHPLLRETEPRPPETHLSSIDSERRLPNTRPRESVTLD